MEGKHNQNSPCPVCHGHRTHVVHKEERLCKFCTGLGEVPKQMAAVVAKWRKKRKKLS